MSELNWMEEKLQAEYDSWSVGRIYEGNEDYSCMFRMSVPDEYLTNGKASIMYVGQECRNCCEYKTKGNWFRHFTELQMLGKQFPEEKKLNSPFWNFARKLYELTDYNIVWNNLDKFHKQNNSKISAREAIELNQPFGDEHLSILQREIRILNPEAIVFTVGKSKYTKSLAAAFSVDEKELEKFEPTISASMNEITNVIGLKDTHVFWSYHPAYLQRIKAYGDVAEEIKNRI